MFCDCQKQAGMFIVLYLLQHVDTVYNTANQLMKR